MKSARRSRRAAVAFGLSGLFHVLILALVLTQVSPIYDLPDAVAPPMDVRIEPLPEPIPRIVVPPPEKLKVIPKTVTPAPTPPAPKPPEPTPVPTPAKPAPTPPAPVITPKPAPAPPVAPKPLPAVAPKPLPVPVVATPLATPQPTPPTPAPPAPAKALTPPAPLAPPALDKLDIHKPKKEAPSSVATLPFAPSPSPASPATQPPPAGAGAEPQFRASQMINPYPNGAMPSGGGGLRGSLAACANAEAVNLSSVERARCDSRFGAAIRSAPALDGINPAKRAEFDKAAESQERDRRYRESAPPPGTERGAHGFGGQGADEPYKVPLGPH